MYCAFSSARGDLGRNRQCRFQELFGGLHLGHPRLCGEDLGGRQGIAHDVQIDAPFSHASKADIVRRGVALGVPFEFTLSCMSPTREVLEVLGVRKVREVQGAPPNEPLEPQAPLEPPEPLRVRHCGTCSKCRERHDGFLEAGVADPTDYAVRKYTS